MDVTQFLADFSDAKDDQIGWSQLLSNENCTNSILVCEHESLEPQSNSFNLEDIIAADKVAAEDVDNSATPDKQLKRKREIKNGIEAKRRIRFKEQLSTLKSLLYGDDANNNNKRVLTREVLLNSAIQEISKLRQELLIAKHPSTLDSTPLERLATGIFPANYYEESLSNPFNRCAYSAQDLERAAQVIFAREIQNFFNLTRQRTEQTVLQTIRMLDDMSKQIGKPEFSLSVGILEQIYYAAIKFSAKDLKRVDERNWAAYQALKKQEASNLILFADAEIGSYILNDMSIFEYLCGNLEESKRYFSYGKQLCKKLSHKGTTCMFLAFQALDFVSCSLDIAEKINQMMPRDQMWSPMATVILGHGLIGSGNHKEGLEKVEQGISTLAARMGHLTQVCLATSLLEAYIQTRSIDKGISASNYILKKCVEFNVDSWMGKANCLKHKATLLMMKKFPDFVTEPALDRITDSSVADLIASVEQVTSANPPEVMGPQPPPSNSFANIPKSYSDDASEDIELLLRSAINLAHSKGMCLVELNCAIDLVKYFMLCGDLQQAEEAAQLVRETCSRMKGDPQSKELQKAHQIIALVEKSVM